MWSQNCNVLDFYEILHSEQIEHAGYEYINWNWWPWPKTTDLQISVAKLKCASIFMTFGA